MKSASRPAQNEIPPAKSAPAGTDDGSRCTVGLLTWRPGEETKRCIIALQCQMNIKIDWVDNASPPEMLTAIRERFPSMPEPQVLPENIGFCAGHNLMLARCKTPYYLALNQDVAIAGGYISRLSDWMDEESDLAMAMGMLFEQEEGHGVIGILLLRGMPAAMEDDRQKRAAEKFISDAPAISSLGLAFPRARYHFQLGAGRKPRPEDLLQRRRIPGVDGAAMMLNLDLCRRAALDPDEIFPNNFFAYYEEIELAQRLARLGLHCGIDPLAVAVHAGKGSGGFYHSPIRARFLANHWLTILRNEPWSLMARELPYIFKGELQYWLREYLSAPAAFIRALGILLREAPAARRFYREFERRHGPTLPGLLKYRADSLEALRREAARR